MGVAWGLHAQVPGKAEGQLTVNGKAHNLRYAAAVRVPDGSDKTKLNLRVVLSEDPMLPEMLFDEGGLFRLSIDGKLHGVQMDFYEGGVNWMLLSRDYSGSFSGSQSPNPFPYQVKGDRVDGSMATDKKGDKESFSIQARYSANIAAYVPEPAPTAADAEAAKKSAAARAYLDLQDAIRKGDRARILAAAPPEARARMDSPEFPEMLKFIQAMQARELRVLKAVETGNEAKLWLAGKSEEGKPQSGKATLQLENGKWIMRKESWKGQ